MLEWCNPTFDQISEASDLGRQYKFALTKRAIPLAALKKLKGEELKIKAKDRFEGWYMRGEMPDGTETADHKKRLQLKPFKIRRRDNGAR